MKMTLGCQGYRTDRNLYSLKLNVDFILLDVSTKNVEDMSEAVKKIELFLGNKIDLVKAVPDKARCYYCASLNDKDVNQCTQCGAAL